jgi:hypothetical protein
MDPRLPRPRAVLGRLRALARLLPVALVAAACADAGTARGAEELPAWTHEVELRIGSVDDPESALTGVGSILAGPDGRFYVGQSSDGQVRIHGSDGSLLGRFGRVGEGPGEFQDVDELGWWAAGRDTLWVWDSRLRRVQLFGADGTFVRSIPITNPPYEEVQRPTVHAMLPDGTALGTSSYPSHLVADGTIRSLAVLRFAVAGGDPELVAETAPGNGQLSLAFGSAQGFSGQPYADNALVALSGDAGRIVVVDRHAATGPEEAAFRVSALSPAGDTLWSRAHPYRPLPIPSAEIDSVRSAIAEPFAQLASRFGVGPGDVEREVELKLYGPDFRPPVTEARVWSDGSIWLEEARVPGDSIGPWLVLEPGGEPVARVELSARYELHLVEGDRAWVVETDELDVPYVVRLRVGPH